MGETAERRGKKRSTVARLVAAAGAFFAVSGLLALAAWLFMPESFAVRWRIGRIQAGVTTRADLVSWFGPPAGESAYWDSYSKGKEIRSSWDWSRKRGLGFELVVTMDSEGVVKYYVTCTEEPTPPVRVRGR